MYAFCIGLRTEAQYDIADVVGTRPPPFIDFDSMIEP